MTVSGVLLAIMGPLMVLLIARGNSFLAFVAQWVLGVLLSFFGGPLCAWLVENFSPEVRVTSVSLGYDIAHATVGGFSPFFATLMYDDFGTAGAGYLYPIFAALSIMGLYIMYCCGGNHLDVHPEDVEMQPNVTVTGGKDLPEVA
jgi:MFS transporter, MHS family, proline/betaine transporter